MYIFKYSFLTSILLFGFYGYAQEVQWACKIASVNDPNKDGDYGVRQCLHIADDYPSQRASGYSYAMGYTNEKIKIKLKLEFCKPMIAQQVLIIESVNPGAITKVSVIDVKGKQKELYKAKPKLINEKNRLLSLTFDPLPNPVKFVYIEALPDKVPGKNAIDAVALSTSKAPISCEINLGSDIEFITPPTPLTSEINTEYVEKYPMISPDGRTMFFVREDHPDNTTNPNHPGTFRDDIWYSIMDDNGRWNPAKNIGKPLNNYDHNFVSSIMPDGNTMVLGNRYTSEGEPAGPGASLTRRIKGNKWSIPENIEITEFQNKNRYVSFFLSNNGKVMLLNIEPDDSYGELDIYVSFLEADGKTWSKPKNIGPDINTPRTEGTPILASDGVTMYFCSNGHFGYGGLDIFMTRRLDDTWLKWSKPINLGPVLNSPGSELGFSVTASGKYVYTYGTNATSKKSDIFVSEITKAKSIKPNPVYLIKGSVYDAKTKKPIAAKIIYETLADGANVGIASSNPDDGSYKIVLPLGKHYGYLAQAEGYIAIHENLEVPEGDEYTEIKKDLYLVPIEVGQTIKLNNVFFERSKAVLLPISYPELDRIADMLKTNSNIEIRLDGHTDNQGDPNKNMELSQQRVEVVKEYLTSKGINPKRITTRAYGGTKPIASNATEETRKLNRRVEFVITKK
ncbi:MAG: OmpA family protein [Cytophagaceae bacterium]|nr:OmpA family protein [Cytophagaceae bacterium]MDW8457338.1 OmpA family protein [Cytophagaceae bacterium]